MGLGLCFVFGLGANLGFRVLGDWWALHDQLSRLRSVYNCCIYNACTGKTNEEIEAEFEGRGYGDFKAAVAEAVIEELRPLQEKFDRISKEKTYLEQTAAQGAEKAARRANRTLGKVMKKVGLWK